VGVGDDLHGAVRNGWTGDALYADHIGDGLDGFMAFEELKVHLHGLIEVPGRPRRRGRVAELKLPKRIEGRSSPHDGSALESQ
jgi:hypothetical protein